jgi:hypothetical protein
VNSFLLSCVCEPEKMFLIDGHATTCLCGWMLK